MRLRYIYCLILCWSNLLAQHAHGLDLCDFLARQYDPATGLFTTMDPLCEKYYHISPYAYCAGNPVNAVDPDGKDWYIPNQGEISWTDYNSQEEMNKNGLQGQYLSSVVLDFKGSQDEKLGKGDNLFVEGANLATATLYGRKGADDITKFEGFTMSSDFKTFGAIDDGEYTVYYRSPGKSGSLKSNWAVENTNPVDCLDGQNPSPLSPYSRTHKNGIYIHTSNKNGYAGKIYDRNTGKLKSAISTGCLLIVPSKYDKNGKPSNNGWDQFNDKLRGVKSFKMLLHRE